MYLSAVGTGRNERFTILCQDFIILGKTPEIQQPSKSALNHPAPFHHFKPLAFSLDDFQVNFVSPASNLKPTSSKRHRDIPHRPIACEDAAGQQQNSV